MPIALMLATLTDRRDFGDDWLLERKFDGERCVARKDGDDGAARVADRQGSHEHLPRGPAGGGGPAAATAPARRRGRRLRRRADLLQPAPAAAREPPSLRPQLVAAYPGRLLRLRPPRGRRRRSHGRAAASSGVPGWRKRFGRAPHCSSARPGAATPSAGSPRHAGPAGRG